MRSSGATRPTLELVALGVASIALAACGLVVSFGSYDTRDAGEAGALYAIEGSVEGLGSTTATLVVNGETPLDVGDGPFVFPRVIADGAGYVVTMPKDPVGHRCMITNGSGKIAGRNGMDVRVHCVEPPRHVAASLVATDQNPGAGYDAMVTIGRATDESDVDSYELYWASDDLVKSKKVASLPRTGADLVVASTGAAPAGATRLLVVTASFAGEMAAGVSTPVVDNVATLVDISAGQGFASGAKPRAVIDERNRKLLVVGGEAGGPGLFRCELDGTGCVYTNVSAGGGDVYDPVPIIDTEGAGKLLVVSTGTSMRTLLLSRCNLDGTSCASTDISAGQPGVSGLTPSPAIDVVNRKLLVVTENGIASVASTPGLFRCNLDGTGCAYANISAGAASQSGMAPSTLIDATNAKLLTVTTDFTRAGKPSLFRCNLDGTSCTYADISAGRDAVIGHTTMATAIADGRLLVVTEGDAALHSTLVRCQLDGTACGSTDVSAGQPSDSGRFPAAAIDVLLRKLYFSVRNADGRASLVRCNIDGTGCTSYAIFGVWNTGLRSTVLIDAVKRKLLVVYEDSTTRTPRLRIVGLW